MSERDIAELLELTRENNRILKKLDAWINKVESQQYKDSEDLKALIINMCADIAVDNNQRQNRLNNDQIFFR